MSIELRILLIIISCITMFYVIRKIRQCKLGIEYASFWIGFSILLILMSVFPQLIYWCTDFLEIQSPVNFVFLVVIFILIIKCFLMTIQISQLTNKLKELVQELALRQDDSKKD